MDAELAKRIHGAARWYTQQGISVIPMRPDEKRPARTWKDNQSRVATQSELDGWGENNLAIVTGVTSGIVVIDCESPEDARWFWRNRGATSVRVRTRRGVHLYFRHPGGTVSNAQRVPDEQGRARYDVRGDGGYVVAPPSYFSGHQYHYIGQPDFARMPAFDPKWRPATNGCTVRKKYTDGVRYIAQIRAISGQGGHADTWRAVCTLRDSGLTESEAMAAMIEWNETNAEPAWTMREILHKVRDSYRRTP